MVRKTYVITDIHGRLTELKSLLAQIPANARMVFLGDYIDRGSQSRGALWSLCGQYPRRCACVATTRT